jgi:hypothetical protein
MKETGKPVPDTKVVTDWLKTSTRDLLNQSTVRFVTCCCVCLRGAPFTQIKKVDCVPALPPVFDSLMENNTPPPDTSRGRGSTSKSVPNLNEYRLVHPVRPLGRAHGFENIDLDCDCQRLILYNVQSFTVAQIWTELEASLGELFKSVVKVNRVSGPNRNPHADLWVLKSFSSVLVSVIRQQTKTRL